jgi:CspA family cold shock protein
MQTSSEENIPSRPQMPSTEQGTVVWFNDGKGFGFIARDNGERDVYVHFMDIVFWTRSSAGDRRRRLNPGERVEFEVFHVEGKPRAKRVSVLKT